MKEQTGQPVLRKIRRDESMKLEADELVPGEVTCDDVARLALSIHYYSVYFSRRRNLRIRFSRDINGSGVQLLEITRNDDEEYRNNIISICFGYTYVKEEQSLYEADLIVDQRKDYEPTISLGNHWFFARSAEFRIDWESTEVAQWRSDIDLLSKPTDTLAAWVGSGLEMFVSCANAFLCGRTVVLTKVDLTRHLVAGLSLDDLKARLTCSGCGSRQARVFVC